MIRSTTFSYLVSASLIFWTHNAWSWEWPWAKTPDPVPNAVFAEEAEEDDDDEDEDSDNISSNNSSSNRSSFPGDHAIADWLNTINIGSFFNFSNKYILDHDQCFVFFNACEDVSAWMEPYGFYSHYRSSLPKSQKMDFTLASYGADLGAGMSITPHINLGAGLGYFHSNLHDKTGDTSDTIHGLYFGPAVEYLFSEGSAACTLFAVKNWYDGAASTSDQSWDLNLRLEGEYDYAPPSDCCIADVMIHPFARIDYLNVFEQSPSEHSSFFYSKLGARFDKVAYNNQSTMITANIDLGWVNMTPLTTGYDDKPESKNQLGLGLAVVGMHTQGLLIGLEYDAALGANAPMQTGRIRIEWNW